MGRRQRLSDWASAAAHMGPAYLRYSFTKGTEQEAAFLTEALGLEPGMRVADIGCGPGRHARALAGVDVVGIDGAATFAALAPCASVGEARQLPLRSGSFDAAFSVGLGEIDRAVLAEAARVLRPGGRLALTAFSAFFAVRHLEEGDRFDPATNTTVEDTSVRNEAGADRAFRLTITHATPRELELLAASVGLEAEHVWSVGPGDYTSRRPDLDHPELLLIASRT